MFFIEFGDIDITYVIIKIIVVNIEVRIKLIVVGESIIVEVWAQ